MGKLKDKYGDPTLFAWFIIICGFSGLLIGGILVACAAWNATFIEGVPTTVTGSIQLHRLRYDRFWNLDYTYVEMRTYSGDTHHLVLYGHVPLEYGATYRITWEKRDYWAHLFLVAMPTEIEQLADVEA